MLCLLSAEQVLPPLSSSSSHIIIKDVTGHAMVNGGSFSISSWKILISDAVGTQWSNIILTHYDGDLDV